MALVFTVTGIEAPLLGSRGRFYLTTGIGEGIRSIYQPEIWPGTYPHPAQPWSAYPVAFHYQNDNNVHLQLNGTFPFSGAWRTPGSRYRVTGTLAAVTIRSADINVPAEGNRVSVPAFTFFGTVPTVRAPFKCAGDWTWNIIHIPPVDTHAEASVTSDVQTRIEAYFFQGSPTWRIVELLRLIVKDLSAINAMTGDIIASYAGHIVRTMWRYGGPALRYDCRRGSGASGYGMSIRPTGRTFLLGSFLLRAVQYCNCHDLAAIIQVCCQALGMKPDLVHVGQEIPFIRTRWIANWPYGHINPGPMFGWLEQDNLHCNSPLWKGNPSVYGLSDDLPSYCADPSPEEDYSRSYFTNHAFIEFFNQMNQPRVLDITHALCPIDSEQVALVQGEQGRDAYILATVGVGWRTEYLGDQEFEEHDGVQSIHNGEWESKFELFL